jgi:hypothetical protein
MKKYKFNSSYGKKQVTVMTWEEFLAYGMERDPQVKSHGSKMPWHFKINDFGVTHENDQKYLVYSMLVPNGGFSNFTPEHVLFITEWGLFPIHKSSFEWMKPEEITKIREISELKTPCCSSKIISEQTFYICSNCKKEMETFVQEEYEKDQIK